MDLQLKDRIVVITGAGKGMGPAISTSFAKEGAKLVLLGRDTEALDILKMAIDEISSALVVKCDVTDPAACAAAVTAAESHFGPVDVLVNVAGGTGPVGATAWETTPEGFDEIIQLNMGGCFLMMRAVLPGMVARRYGKIVNVGGTFGMHGRAGRMAYSASKWGLRGITKSTAIEAGPYNVNVNIVAPGMVDGPRFRTKVMPGMAEARGLTEDEVIAEHAAEYALRRISTAEDVASACLFLASDVSRQITGVDLPVDGGWASL
ncbi:SDR family NAD(P)-dependent oxidoreductase [Novosphingobium aerophilum]|uniref:SDR family NAD(P)-dependent oxidoreductase n=1 Tax=Novosphingobium TaxID=165696 RepID=UPI002D7A1D8F|nr:SDR family NAD(P)-dependent oxidoreductase [Novosphingobium sp. RL4]WRT95331.1 SDR family NAD(P)-dependent oxidoreductase [Novosphingobium sp. RL4]